jgi:hypothetical protein
MQQTGVLYWDGIIVLQQTGNRLTTDWKLVMQETNICNATDNICNATDWGLVLGQNYCIATDWQWTSPSLDRGNPDITAQCQKMPAKLDPGDLG